MEITSVYNTGTGVVIRAKVDPEAERELERVGFRIQFAMAGQALFHPATPRNSDFTLDRRIEHKKKQLDSLLQAIEEEKQQLTDLIKRKEQEPLARQDREAALYDALIEDAESTLTRPAGAPTAMDTSEPDKTAK